ncbi:KilA-N domain-containing protein [Azotobacter chroococcum]|uniref:ORF11CD3 domain-containing protein n=1 Tax=Azotobacter chroococcum TaxID=353 RepID=A0A4V2Q734_9GAMM|nr:KilA-N domain-containing protein [Azotobacter chroococcum]TBV95966.1 DNA-binding protein [Azotobacter chroococcum]TCL26815.1 ORF11CD3 domain-containing protein [Azotobacter chroococcum]
MSNVIPFHYQGQPVRFNSDGWINATDIAAGHGLRLDNWLRNKETEAYIAALARHLNTSDSRDLIRAQRGRSGGTWLHPKLAVALARWISPDFAVWADLHIDALLRGELTEKQQFDRACKALSDGQSMASLNAKELAKWRWRKPGLEHEVDHWRHQLQLTLGFDAA